MTSQLSQASLVNSLSISGAVATPMGYYRSKLFVAPFSSNPIAAAGGPVMSLLERLCISPTLPPIVEIRDNIEHEIHAFHSKLNAAKYPGDIISIAHYLLCATIDELIGKNYLRVYQTAPEFNAFTPLTRDGAKPEERFFDIIHYIKERPNQYLDLIELGYFCLIAGFEGTFHLKTNGRQILDNHIEDLYQLIQNNRHHKPHRLFHENPLPKTITQNYRTTLITVAVAGCFVLASFLSSRLILEYKAESVLQQHTQLALMDN
jgi:type VI secretion system protein ImpK